MMQLMIWVEGNPAGTHANFYSYILIRVLGADNEDFATTEGLNQYRKKQTIQIEDGG